MPWKYLPRAREEFFIARENKTKNNKKIKKSFHLTTLEDAFVVFNVSAFFFLAFSLVPLLSRGIDSARQPGVAGVAQWKTRRAKRKQKKKEHGRKHLTLTALVGCTYRLVILTRWFAFPFFRVLFFFLVFGASLFSLGAAEKNDTKRTTLSPSPENSMTRWTSSGSSHLSTQIKIKSNWYWDKDKSGDFVFAFIFIF